MALTDASPPTPGSNVVPEDPSPGQAPIRIAQVVGKVVMSGVDQVVMNYYRHIDRDKIQFDFFMDGLGDTPLDEEIRTLGGRVFKLPAYEDGLRTNLAAFRKYLHSLNYQIVHSHMNALSVFWLREAKMAGVPVRIAHSHSTGVVGEGKRALVKAALRPFARLYPSHHLACSSHAAEWLFGRRALASGAVELLKNAIDTSKFEYNEETRKDARAEFGFSDEMVLGHVGRFEYQKNHEFLIDVFSELVKRRPDARLLLVGDGSLLDSITAMCENRNVLDRVVLTGTRTDVPRLMQAMDCFVFPSRFEGLGMVVIEAQAAGLPCVVSTEVPREAVLTNTVTSLDLANSPAHWAQIVADMCGTRQQALDEMGAVRSAGFCIREAAPRLASFYRDLAGRTGR